MSNQNPGDLFEENVASAAQTLMLANAITNEWQRMSKPDVHANVLSVTSPNGALRLERSGDTLILDIAPQSKVGNKLQSHSFRLEASHFRNSPAFQTDGGVLPQAIETLQKTIENLGDAPTLIFYNDGRMKHGILARIITEQDTAMHEQQDLIEGACQAIAAMLPPGRALHRQSAAFGAPPRLCIINETDNTILTEPSLHGLAAERLAAIEPYLSLLPEVMFIRPDADNPNTVELQPMAMSYAPPADRPKAIMRLASVMIRLRLLAG